MNKADHVAIDTIIQVIKEMYGFDFQHYAKASLKRRLQFHQSKQQLASLADMIPLLINNKRYFNELLIDLSVTVTEMFRDPWFYETFANVVIPQLKTYSYSKIWHAGCATGEEVYSMAILLKEQGLLDRVQLYGTDFNAAAIDAAKKGIYGSEHLDKYEQNYLAAGGKSSIREYVTEKYHAVKVSPLLADKMTFSCHDLATDHSFGEVEVIICRNVLIYFDAVLKERVLRLFQESLADYGYLCIGSKEKVDDPAFKLVDRAACIYQKVPHGKK